MISVPLYDGVSHQYPGLFVTWWHNQWDKEFCLTKYFQTQKHTIRRLFRNSLIKYYIKVTLLVIICMFWNNKYLSNATCHCVSGLEGLKLWHWL